MARRGSGPLVALIALALASSGSDAWQGVRGGAARRLTVRCSATAGPSPSARLERAKERLASLQEADLILSGKKAASAEKIRQLECQVAEPEVSYNPQQTAEKLYQQPLTWLFRNVQLAVPLTLFTASIATDIVSGSVEKMQEQRAEELLRILSGFGPAIIKGGQALSSRPDLLPAAYLKSLQKLQDQVPPFPEEQAFAQFRAEIGRDFNDVFELVEPQPIAAASIGQVYKARLRANGALVAVKIQRPKCENIISLDLFILRWYSGVLTRLLRALGRDIDLVSVIDDFGELIFREIDYRAEASNAARFAELYAGVPDVFVPRVYPDLTTAKILTMEWVEGVRLTDKRSLETMGVDPARIVDTLVQCSLRQILETGFFHADPHAGNLLAMPNGKLCYLDFGMVSYAERFQRYSIIEAVVHLINRDFESLAGLYKRMGFIPADIDAEPIVVALEKALPDVLGASVGELNFRNVINSLGDVFYRFPFRLEPYYVAILRCLAVLEGVAIQVDPEFRIIEDAYPYIAGKLLTDSTPQLQSALRQLLLDKDGDLNWSRMEQLFGTAKSSQTYDVTAAAELLVDYLFTPEGLPVLSLLEQQIVETLDTIGVTSAKVVPAALAAATAPSTQGRASPLARVLAEARASTAERVGDAISRRVSGEEEKAEGGAGAAAGYSRVTERTLRVGAGDGAAAAGAEEGRGAQDAVGSAATTATAVLLDAVVEALDKDEAAEAAAKDAATATTIRILRTVVSSPGFRNDAFLSLARKVLSRKEAQDMSQRIVVALGERAISRGIRNLVRGSRQ